MPAEPEGGDDDMKPEMSAAEVTKAAKAAILSGKYALIVVNFANPDMVGHTGSLPAAIKAVETTDACVGELLEALGKSGAAPSLGLTMATAARRATTAPSCTACWRT